VHFAGFLAEKKKKKLLHRGFLVDQLSKTLRKHLQGSKFQKTFLCCLVLTKCEVKVNKNIWLRATEIVQFFFVALSKQFFLNLASRFVTKYAI
jgi:hypothetical protein